MFVFLAQSTYRRSVDYKGLTENKTVWQTLTNLSAIVTLTDIIVAFSLTKLFSQSKWSKTLELFGELLRSVRGKGMTTLPAHLVI